MELMLVIAVLVVFWIVGLMIHPWRHCTRCDSNPRTYRSGSETVFRICGKCGGTGRQLRWFASWFRSGP